MSREVLRQVAERMATDAVFRRTVVADPLAALAAYDLTDLERLSLLPDTVAGKWEMNVPPETDYS
jgi:hypothetical protein